MPILKRGRDNFGPTNGTRACPLWEAIENVVHDISGTKPFDPVEISGVGNLQYLPSQTPTNWIEIGDGHSRYQAELEPVSFQSDRSLGPVESNILSFAASKTPMLAVLLGGMGSGKSTTIRYLMRHHLTQYKVIFCDLDANIDAASDTEVDEGVTAKILANYLSPELNMLITPDEEFKNIWTWGLSGGKYVLSNAQDQLRESLGQDWLLESSEALDIKKKCRSELFKNPSDKLTYQGFLIDYYLTCRCNGDRSHLLLVIDNVDPLPPQRQFQILNLAMRLQKNAHCKVLVAMRPLTYSSNLQGGSTIVEVIDHAGPSVIDLIASRVRSMILDKNLSKLSFRLHDDGRPDRMIGELEVKRWVAEILRTILRDQRHSSLLGEPVARTFIEGVCGQSLRSALVVAPKIFGSSAIPLTDPDLEPLRNRPRVRDHDVIRAVLEGWNSYYFARQSRVTDNIFDLGVGLPSNSCTSKIRLLKLLSAAGNGIATITQIRQQLAFFGHTDQLILDTVNSAISQIKRLAWSDSVANYKSLDSFANSKIQITTAGRFYITYAIFNLEYVQGVHIDVLLPIESILKHDPRHFADRLRSVELFARYLYQQDKGEVQRLLANNAVEDYHSAYGNRLFSCEVIDALARQAQNVGRSMIASRPRSQEREDIEETMERWRDLSTNIGEDSRMLVEKISMARGATL